jgi:hypothetical protein
MTILSVGTQNGQHRVGKLFNDRPKLFVDSPLSSSPTVATLNGDAHEVSKTHASRKPEVKPASPGELSHVSSSEPSTADTTVWSTTLLAKFIDAFHELEKYK